MSGFTVLEFEESFGVFHLAADLATEAVCGRKGRLLRLLPADTWEGAPGPLPASFCRRCSAASGRYEIPTRTAQLEAIQSKITGGHCWEAGRWLYYRSGKTGQAGVGYVTLRDEAERIAWNERCDGNACLMSGAAS